MLSCGFLINHGTRLAGQVLNAALNHCRLLVAMDDSMFQLGEPLQLNLGKTYQSDLRCHSEHYLPRQLTVSDRGLVSWPCHCATRS